MRLRVFMSAGGVAIRASQLSSVRLFGNVQREKELNPRRADAATPPQNIQLFTSRPVLYPMYIQLYTPHTMLDTSSFQPHHDPHRVIALVTGANSGYGLGICHQLLSNLSLPSTVPIPASTPQPTALPPSMRDSIRSNSLQPTKISVPETTLTLILACRSGAKAQEAIDILWKKHKSDLEKRKKKGLAAKEGWLEGLRIVWEGVNLDSPGGENGILAFTERVRNR